MKLPPDGGVCVVAGAWFAKQVRQKKLPGPPCVGLLNAAAQQRNSGAPMYTIAVIGPGGVGKSALCVRLVSGHFVERYDPTIEDTYRATVHLEGTDESVTLELWDTAGQAEYAAGMMWTLRRCDGYIVVVTCAERSVVDTYMRTYAPVVRRYITADEMPYVVAINKTDLAPELHVVDAEYVVRHRLVHSADDVVAVSVLNNTGVHDVFARLVARIDAQRHKQASSSGKHSKDAMRSTPSSDSMGSPRSTTSASPRSPRAGCCMI